MPDILDEIVARRREDYARLGPTFGVQLAERRSRPLVPFMAEPGAILEIKRASPSKGDIACGLDPGSLARQYAAAGAKNVSVLTERRFFRGSLEDLVAASSGCDGVAFLRKDFILYEDEISVAWRAGADAVLLIARILDTPLLLKLAALCRAFGMTPFIEVRDGDDVAKLCSASREGPVLAGVNSRDLATFTLDPLVPAALLSLLPGRAVFESGARSPLACAFARRLGFDGILVGEAAARDPAGAGSLVDAFRQARPDWVGHFWRDIARRRAIRAGAARGRTGDDRVETEKSARTRPLVKICGLSRAEDALCAASLGADLLGFVFAPSPRQARAETVREVAQRLSAGAAGTRPLLVGVIVDPESPGSREAFGLVREGFLDAIQYQGDNPARALPLIERECGTYGVGRYAAVSLGSRDDLARIDELVRQGEPRTLIDARVAGKAGGTGATVAPDLVRSAAERGRLWLAGGLKASNVRQCIDEFGPELIDASSGLESEPGIKDHAALQAFFREIDR